MAPRKLNVLVYTGTGATLGSIRHCIYTLRRLLSPNYAVVPLTESALLNEPWAPTCAMLVFPGGADLGYCNALNGAGNRIITSYVRRGGKYLGFCAGGYYGSKKCEFEVGDRTLEVVGSRELSFFPGTCRGGAFRGFQYSSEHGARAARLKVHQGSFENAGGTPAEFRSYYNGGGVFVDAVKMADQKVEVLASYVDALDVDGGDGKAAVICCKVGEGQAMLTGPHPEFAPVNLDPNSDVSYYDQLIAELMEDDALRIDFLKACLTKLGLEVNQGNTTVPSLSKLHLTALDSQDVAVLLHSFTDIITKGDDGEELIKGGPDVFRIESEESRWSVDDLTAALPTSTASLTVPMSNGNGTASSSSASTPEGSIDYSTIVKVIVPHEDAWPLAKRTPYFNHTDYYRSLQEVRQHESEALQWGNTLLYGEVVTSTNTLLEKNHPLLSKLPTGFTLTATTQVAGRGRGANVWIAPPGSLLFSTVINHPIQLAQTRPVVFFQYLAAVAIVEAIHSYGQGYDALPVKLKWPNDIYARDPTAPNDKTAYVKICGILTNCAYSGGNYQLVLGIGINTANGRPTTSLDALIPAFAKEKLPSFRIERLLARILTKLEVTYNEFLRHGFSRDLEDRYYSHWLHTNQIVTLENEGGIKARITGITRDWGLLKAEEIGFDGRPTGRTIALQSDENSFDFWRGLVKRKI